MKYVLVAWLFWNGQIHEEALDRDLTFSECLLTSILTESVWLEQLSEHPVVPLGCIPEVEV